MKFGTGGRDQGCSKLLNSNAFGGPVQKDGLVNKKSAYRKEWKPIGRQELSAQARFCESYRHGRKRQSPLSRTCLAHCAKGSSRLHLFH
jgi:hypothetical protein